MILNIFAGGGSLVWSLRPTCPLCPPSVFFKKKLDKLRISWYNICELREGFCMLKSHNITSRVDVGVSMLVPSSRIPFSASALFF